MPRRNTPQRDVIFEDGLVYFAHAPDAQAVKIGWSQNPIARLESLRAGLPGDLLLLGTVPGNRWTERDYHERFAGQRLRGEWFQATDRLLDALRWDAFTKGVCRTVQEELMRRQKCRYGLGEAAFVGLRGRPSKVFKVRCSEWDRNGELRVSVYLPGTEPDESDLGSHYPDGFHILRASELAESAHRWDSVLLHAHARDVFLLSDWPVVCPCWLPEPVESE